MVVPAAMPASSSFWVCSSAQSRSAFAAKTALPRKGEQHSARTLRQRRDVVGQRRLVQDVYTVAAGESVSVVRTPLPFDRRDLCGPFDVIGDVHGCCDELEELLAKLGYAVTAGAWRHAEPRSGVPPNEASRMEKSGIPTIPSSVKSQAAQ